MFTYVFFGASIAVSGATAGGSAPYFSLTDLDTHSFRDTASSGLVRIESTQAGLQDLAFSVLAHDTFLFVVGRRDSEMPILKQQMRLPDDGSLVRVLPAPGLGYRTVLTVGRGGVAREYGGEPLVERRQLPIVPGASAAGAGDVDGDGIEDLVVSTQTGVFTYRLSDGALSRTYAFAGTQDLALAQLDADPALEIVLAGAAGRVIDGATQALEWQYIDGFGSRLAIGSLGGMSADRWVSAGTGSAFTAFRSGPWSPLWTAYTPFEVSLLAIAPFGAQGHGSVFVGDTVWSGVGVHDAATGAELTRITSPRPTAVSDVSMLEVDRADLAIASQPVDPNPALLLASSLDGSTLWGLRGLSGADRTAILDDVDGDGHPELLTGGSAITTLRDAASGHIEWTAEERETLTPFQIAVTSAKADASRRIALAGNGPAGVLIVLDGSTREQIFRVADPFTGKGAFGYSTRGLVVSDVDADGLEDYLFASQSNVLGGSPAKLTAVSGIDGHQLWMTDVPGSPFNKMSGLLLIDTDAAPSGKAAVVVTRQALNAYDVATGAELWTMLLDNHGASYVSHGVDGRPELAVFTNHSKMTYFDASTRAVLRNYPTGASDRLALALGGDVHRMLIATQETLVLVDGSTGQTLATSPDLGPVPEEGFGLAAAPMGRNAWVLGLSTENGLYRLRLVLDEQLFFDSFEGP
ncbi:MAG TPA: hypothetical protein VMR06_04135 [Dokdonella sp.]|nr:hypothetical protein [Dokdonella sp.]